MSRDGNNYSCLRIKHSITCTVCGSWKYPYPHCRGSLEIRRLRGSPLWGEYGYFLEQHNVHFCQIPMNLASDTVCLTIVLKLYTWDKELHLNVALAKVQLQSGLCCHIHSDSSLKRTPLPTHPVAHPPPQFQHLLFLFCRGLTRLKTKFKSFL